VKAVRITPVGVQEGLKPITPGNKKIVPEEDNFYNSGRREGAILRPNQAVL
jgi:hypothetical protein